MFTPQQIEQVSFSKQAFNGYDIQSVDAFLEPLVDDYITLYKENALLKSKMRVLVSKLEEYRKNEASMKDAIVNAQKTCDMMVKEAETKCTQMLTEANAAAIENAKNADSLIAEENARVEEARNEAAAKIAELQEQLSSCIAALEHIKQANRAAAPVAQEEAHEDSADKTAAVADEIAANLEAMMGTIEETAPKAEPKPAMADAATSKFTNLRFGPNYDPTAN